MNKKIIALGIVFILSFITLLASAQQIEINRKTLNQGEFEAQLGLNRNDRLLYHLNGNFNMRGRIRMVGGICTSSDQETRFQGAFIGNSFFIKIIMRGESQTIFGRIRVNDDYSIFTGSWNSRGLDSLGWISGEFKTRG